MNRSVGFRVGFVDLNSVFFVQRKRISIGLRIYSVKGMTDRSRHMMIVSMMTSMAMQHSLKMRLMERLKWNQNQLIWSNNKIGKQNTFTSFSLFSNSSILEQELVTSYWHRTLSDDVSPSLRDFALFWYDLFTAIISRIPLL